MRPGNAPSGSQIDSTLGFWRILTRSKSMFAVAIGAGIAAGIGTAGLLSLINRAIEAETPNERDLAGRYFALCVVVLVAHGLSLVCLPRLAQDSLYELRMWLTRSILAAPLQQLQRAGPHRLMAALTEDIGSILGVQQAVPAFAIALSTLAGGLFYLGYLSPILVLLVLAVLFVGVAGYKLLMRGVARSLRLARLTENELFRLFRVTTDGHKELKMDANRRRVFLDEEMVAVGNEYRRRQNHASAMSALAESVGRSLYFLLVGGIVFVAPATGLPLHREVVSGFVLVILFLGGPLSVLLTFGSYFERGLAGLRSLESLGFDMSRECERLVEAAPPRNSVVAPVLELRNVAFRYEASDSGDNYRLGPLDLKISPGELLFVTGGNGSGKTTLAMLILGLYPPTTGEIRLGDDRIIDENRDRYRQHFSAVFADPFIFESLLGYSSTACHRKAEGLLDTLELSDKVSIRDGRFSTVDLSKGLRKRLALLSAYVSDRPFFLFDEWAADQDPVFREMFYCDLLPQLKARGKTVIVITHDDRYFRYSDRIIRLDRGQVVEPATKERASSSEEIRSDFRAALEF